MSTLSAKERLAAILAKKKAAAAATAPATAKGDTNDASKKMVTPVATDKASNSILDTNKVGDTNGKDTERNSESSRLPDTLGNSVLLPIGDDGLGALDLPAQNASSGIPTPASVLASSSQNPLLPKLQELEAALHQRLPDMPYILKHIFDSLREDPEVVTLFSPEEIGLVTAGMIQHTQTTIIAAPKKATKKSQPLTLDALD